MRIGREEKGDEGGEAKGRRVRGGVGRVKMERRKRIR